MKIENIEIITEENERFDLMPPLCKLYPGIFGTEEKWISVKIENIEIVTEDNEFPWKLKICIEFMTEDNKRFDLMPPLCEFYPEIFGREENHVHIRAHPVSM